MTTTWCVGGRHKSDTNNIIEYKKFNPRTKKLVKIIKDVFKNAECSHGHRSAMSNSVWCDLNKNCTVLKLHDMCHNPKCKCQKYITFSPNQFQLEGAGFKNTMKKKHIQRIPNIVE